MATPSPLILLVDDFEDARQLYQTYLIDKGYRVVTAASGPEAIACVRHEAPDLILLDERMPGMSGTEALLKLRADPAFEHRPILAFTAHALETDRRAMLEAGFDAVIAKPCLPDALAQVVERVLRMPWV